MKFNLYCATVLLFLVHCIPLITFAQERAQEKIKVDDETVNVVPSPWQLIPLETTASFRGLHVLNENEIYASGTGGTIISSVDGGKNWRVTVVPGAEELDFRDIQAVEEGVVIAMTSGTPARIYRSTNGGLGWKLVYEHKDPRVFLDALSFWDSNRGVIMGDPITERLFLLRTFDAGKTWSLSKKYPNTQSGEAGFAASGTNMITIGKQKLMVGLGSANEGEFQQTSRVVYSEDNFASWQFGTVPISRSQSSGIFSLCFANGKDGVAVGGDYKKENDSTSNYAVTRDGGKTWSAPSPRQPPSGYRSCVARWTKNREVYFVAAGPNGCDASTDLGNKWYRISNEGFNTIAFSKDSQQGWAVGANGRLAKWLGIAKVAPIKMTEKTISKGPIDQPAKIK